MEAPWGGQTSRPIGQKSLCSYKFLGRTLNKDANSPSALLAHLW